jgi:hypothetical protein
VESFITKCCIILPHEELTNTPILFDTGAEANVVSYAYVLLHNIKCEENASLPAARLLTGKDRHCYGTYTLEIDLTDSWGSKC